MDMYAYAKSVVESQVCEVHNQHPRVRVVNNDFSIDCCCRDFKIECLKTVIQILVSEKDKKLRVAWKKNVSSSGLTRI